MKLSQLKQLIKEEIKKASTPEETLFDKLLKKYESKGVVVLAKDKEYIELKEKNKKLAADLVGKVRRRSEMES